MPRTKPRNEQAIADLAVMVERQRVETLAEFRRQSAADRHAWERQLISEGWQPPHSYLGERIA